MPTCRSCCASCGPTWQSAPCWRAWWRPAYWGETRVRPTCLGASGPAAPAPPIPCARLGPCFAPAGPLLALRAFLPSRLPAERGSIKEVDSVERVGLVVSVLHLPPGSSLHAALINDGLTPNYSNPDWQPPEGELPHGPAKHTRTWLVLSDRHAHVDGVLQEVRAGAAAQATLRTGGPRLLCAFLQLLPQTVGDHRWSSACPMPLQLGRRYPGEAICG